MTKAEKKLAYNKKYREKYPERVLASAKKYRDKKCIEKEYAEWNDTLIEFGYGDLCS